MATLASSEWSPGMPLHILRYRGQPRTTKVIWLKVSGGLKPCRGKPRLYMLWAPPPLQHSVSPLSSPAMGSHADLLARSSAR